MSQTQNAGNNPTIFEQYASLKPGTFVVEGNLVAIGNAEYAGSVGLPLLSGDHASTFATANETDNEPSISATDFDAGDVLEYVCAIVVNGFTGLSANYLAGVGLWQMGPSENTDALRRDTFNKTHIGGVGNHIIVGVDSGGNVYVVTDNGSKTAVDTGVNYVAGEMMIVDIKFTKGTNVVVKVRTEANPTGATTTITTTLPTRICAWALGTGLGSGNTAKHYGGAYRFTKA